MTELVIRDVVELNAIFDYVIKAFNDEQIKQ
jgi:hypothetical protein